MNPNPRLFSFVGGQNGLWRVSDLRAIRGEALPAVEWLEVVSGHCESLPAGAAWVLRGATSNERYVTRAEKEQLVARQEALGRPGANCAALIPIQKNADWWAMPQDERRRIFEQRSQHTRIGLDYLPAVARRLHHCRDLSQAEPFDFLTWFEFGQGAAAEFDRLLERLRASEEWTFVEREVEIRCTREAVHGTT